jgi:hypothetical protein
MLQNLLGRLRALFAPSGPRAYALVHANAGGTPTLDASRTKNFTAVSRPLDPDGNPVVGVYCLTPTAGIDPATAPAVVSADWGLSAGSSLFAYTNFATPGLPGRPCPAASYEVHTRQLPQVYSDGETEPSNDVSFTILVA